MSVQRRIGGRYRLLAKVGTGGLGVLWAALDDRGHQHVAVRILQRGIDQPSRVAHFRASARAAARLSHPSIGRVLDEGHDAVLGPYIVSEWIDGFPLSAWRGVELPWLFVRSIALQLCSALSHVHARGLVHLDLRPANILIAACGDGPLVRIVDVGCARIDDGWSDRAAGAEATVKLLGSMKYMAPEVGDAPPWQHGPWSDLYTFGLVLWELLCGSLPDADLQGISLLMRRRAGPAPLLPKSAGGKHHAILSTLLQRLLSASPGDRPHSAVHVRRTLETLAPSPGEAIWVDPRRGPAVRHPSFNLERGRAGAYPLLALEPGPLVGRADLLQAAMHDVNAVVSGLGSRVVLLTGGSGMGKSSVAREIAFSAEEQGAARAWTVSFSSGSAPGGGLVGAIEDLLRVAGSDADAIEQRVPYLSLLAGLDGDGLEQILPALLRPDPAPFIRPGNAADSGSELGSIGSAHMVAGVFHEMLRRAAGNDAIVLLLDDLQFATLAEGVDLVRRIIDEPTLSVCVIATVTTGQGLFETIETLLPASDRVRILPVLDLSTDDVRSYLEQRLGPLADDLEPVTRAAGTYPLMVRGLADLLLDGQLLDLRPTDDGPENGAQIRLSPSFVAPESWDELFASQFARLAGSVAEALVPDIVCGLAFGRVPLTPMVMRALIEIDPDKPWERALAAAERARIIERSPGGRWTFTCNAVRDWLVISGEERAQTWHWRWIKTLVALEEGGRGRFGIERAAHAESCGDHQLALSALGDAATWALGPGQLSLERALLAARHAQTLAQVIGDTTQQARAHRLRSALLRQAGHREGAVAALFEATVLLKTSPDPFEQAACQLVGAWLDADVGQLDAARIGFEAAHGNFTVAGSVDGEFWAQLGLGHLASRAGQHAFARSMARICEDGFGTLNAGRGTFAARLLRARAADAAKDFVTADRRYLRIQELADGRRWLLEATLVRIARIRVALEQQRPDAALTLIDQARGVAENVRLCRLREWLDCVHPAALAAAGQGREARLALKKAEIPNPQLRPSAIASLVAGAHHERTLSDPPLAGAIGQWISRLQAQR